MEAADQDKKEKVVEETKTNVNEEESTLKNEQVTKKPEKEVDLLTWVAPARPFKRRDKQFYVTTISIASLVCLILFLAEGAMPVILIISLIFLYYVMSTVEPENIEYRITNKGIKIDQKTTPWDLLGRFWFDKRYDSQLLIVETLVLPGRMELVVDTSKKEEIKKTLSDYLTEEKISPSRLDRMVSWFGKKLPQ